MEISIAVQTVVFLKAVLLGALLGVIYDGLRAVRCTLRTNTYITALLDTMFWCIALVALFLFALIAADGEGRWYILLGTGMGAALYFLTCSPPLLCAACLLVEVLAKIVQLPAVLWKKTGAILIPLKNRMKTHNKIQIFLKNAFHFSKR